MKQVVFSDESRFNLSIDGNRVCVWRPRGERIIPAFASQRDTPPTAGVMVWGAIAYNTRSPIVLIRGTMTAQWYVHDILQPHVLPLMQRLQGAIFQQDNAQSHTARVSQDCLRPVTTIPWPACSSDLSPIEHIWDHLGRRVGHPASLNELEARLQEEWNEMSQDIIQNLYASMPDHIASCIRARWGSTGCQVIYSQFGLAIHQNDHQERRRFVEWAQNKIAVVPDFHRQILFSDEAHFWFNGYVNKQNCRIWSEANPQVYVETPLHPEN
ncbi:transposable element Tcb2 transposase [Trichonephila clavipes]|uniref:Transposable element Tcb2 transposase n=1 Tax=Trichonephila clavipes TaxID=2585209 RepID=A0A8X6RRU9_TRICX|nr:transposable element Tcb2 transposase [Trichonephila clavipes]